LFFDLAFIFALSQIVHMLVEYPDWEHVGKAAQQFTWADNAVLVVGAPALFADRSIDAA
jgi:low temperature requirement protein LtrA